MNKIKKRKLVSQSIEEYLTDRNLGQEKVIERDIETIKKVIDDLIQKSETISSITSIDYRIIKAKTQGLESLLIELKNDLEVRKKVEIPPPLIEYIIDEEDIKTKQSVKLIIKTYLNIITVDKRQRPKILIGFKTSLSNDIFRYEQGRMTKHQAEQIANTISNFIFDKKTLFNSRKNKDKKFLNAPFGGYLIAKHEKPVIEKE